MLSRQHFIELIEKEVSICKHLHSKIPADAFDFRPSEEQRSITELLRYLSVCGSASMHVMLNDSDWKLWKPYAEYSTTMQPEEFPAAMDKQVAAMTEMFDTIADEDFHALEVKHPIGDVMPLGVGLIRMPLSWLTAYRMQLFLYLKQVGVPELGTSNAWGGFDRKPKV